MVKKREDGKISFHSPLNFLFGKSKTPDHLLSLSPVKISNVPPNHSSRRHPSALGATDNLGIGTVFALEIPAN